MVLCGMFAALVAIGAFIQIPVPYMDYFTLQFFFVPVSYTHLRAHETDSYLVCRLLLEKKKKKSDKKTRRKKNT